MKKQLREEFKNLREEFREDSWTLVIAALIFVAATAFAALGYTRYAAYAILAGVILFLAASMAEYFIKRFEENE